MNLNSFSIRIIFAALGILCGAICGFVIGRVVLLFLPLDGIDRTNGIVVGAVIGAGIGYGVSRILRLRLVSNSHPKDR